VLVLVNKRNT